MTPHQLREMALQSMLMSEDGPAEIRKIYTKASGNQPRVDLTLEDMIQVILHYEFPPPLDTPLGIAGAGVPPRP